MDLPPADHGFGIDHLPWGVFSIGSQPPRVGVRLGDEVVDAPALLGEWSHLLDAPSLDPLMAAGSETWRAVRANLVAALTDRPDPIRHAIDDVTMHLPVTISDYVDFYASEHHASNVGRLFRPDSEPLLPNWKHLPVGYHGRAGTVVASGTPIVRPSGQRKPTEEGQLPPFGPSERLDIEAEVGFVVGVGSELGTPVPASAFADHVFGVCLVNDWSARDIQAWEYVPLGPFLGKSFATSMAHWITPLSALRAARTTAPPRDVQVSDYLAEGGDWGLDLHLEVAWNGQVVSHPPFADMYWTGAHMLAHLTVNGATVRTGDLYASGTVSGPTDDTVGSFLELTHGGAQPVEVAGDQRTFLADGDEVVIRATAPGANGSTLRLGEVSGRILPAR